MNALKVIGGLVVLSIAASNIGYAVGMRQSRKIIAEEKAKVKVGEAK